MFPMWLQGTTLQQTFKIPKETPHFREGRMSYKEIVEYTLNGKTFMCDHYYYYDDYGYNFKYTTTELDKINLELLYKAYKSL